MCTVMWQTTLSMTLVDGADRSMVATPDPALASLLSTTTCVHVHAPCTKQKCSHGFWVWSPRELSLSPWKQKITAELIYWFSGYGTSICKETLQLLYNKGGSATVILSQTATFSLYFVPLSITCTINSSPQPWAVKRENPHAKKSGSWS